MPTRCPCLSGLPYDECCGRLHREDSHAATTEQLMRSRFSAFAVGDAEYLLATWHRATRPRQPSNSIPNCAGTDSTSSV